MIIIATLILVVGGIPSSHDISRWSLDAGASEFDYTEADETTVCHGIMSFQFDAHIVDVTAQVCLPDQLFEGNFE